MASLKDVRDKIGGVKKTKQITKAMYMVASAKLRGAQQRIERFSPYADKFQAVLSDLASKTDETAHPLLARRELVKTTGILLVTSDRGLCGSFNINIISKALAMAKKSKAAGKNVFFYCVGKKGRDAVHRAEYDIAFELVGQMGALDFQMANSTSLTILHDFLSAKVDEVMLVYGHSSSRAHQTAIDETVLPIPRNNEQNESITDTGIEYLYEPSIKDLLAEILPRSVKVQVYRGMLDTSASEHAARMSAMDNATRNCDDIETQLTLLFNKTRQAAITTDLIDIVSGAEALNG